MKSRPRLSLSFAIAFLGCLSISACTSDSEESDPFQGLSCREKIDKMAREVNAFAGNRLPAAKIAASDSDSVSTAGKIIVNFRGYPPVVQTDTSPVHSAEVDTRATGTNPDSVRYVITWIPPVGFSDSASKGSAVQLDSLGNVVPETSSPVPLPTDISVIKVVSDEAYRAHVRIIDYKGEPVGEFDQDFGYHGELENPQRIVQGGKVSYLVWKYTDADGHRPVDGLYTWQARFIFASRKVIDTTGMTGLLDPACNDPQ